MTDQARGAGFPVKALDPGGITRDLVVEELEREALSEEGMLDQINRPEPSRADALEDDVLAVDGHPRGDGRRERALPCRAGEICWGQRRVRPRKQSSARRPRQTYPR